MENMTFSGSVPTGIHTNPPNNLYKIGGVLHVREWQAGNGLHDFHQAFAFFLNPDGTTWDVHNLCQELRK